MFARSCKQGIPVFSIYLLSLLQLVSEVLNRTFCYYFGSTINMFRLKNVEFFTFCLIWIHI